MSTECIFIYCRPLQTMGHKRNKWSVNDDGKFLLGLPHNPAPQLQLIPTERSSSTSAGQLPSLCPTPESKKYPLLTHSESIAKF